MTEPRILVADIGGTNTRVGIAEGARIDRDAVRRYRNADFPDLGAALRRYLADLGREVGTPDAACVAAAGPVADERARLTNLDWEITPETLARATGAAEVGVINDLQAQGFALPHLDPQHLETLVPADAPPPDTGTQLVVGLGTGVNAAPVHRVGDGVFVPPAEAGHGDLPAASPAVCRLAEYLRQRHVSGSVEEALAGRGIARIHAFLAAEAGRPDPGLSPAEIVAAHATGGDEAATRTLSLYSEILGHVLGDLALAFLPVAGIVLAGGVARSVAPHAVQLGLGRSFRDKGRFSAYMGRFRIALLTDDFAALTGAAASMAQRLRRPVP